MSTTNQDKVKIVLERSGPDEFWEEIERHYAKADPIKWKCLAALALREVCQWPVERIAFALDQDKGYISRSLTRVRAELRERIQMTPDWKPDHPQRHPDS